MKLSGKAFDLGPLSVSWKAVLVAACVLAAHYLLFGLILEKRPVMRIFRNFVRGVSAGCRHFGNTMKFLLAEVCITLLGLTPLLFLLAPGYRYLAALAYPVWLLLVNPARMNAAAAMQECLEGGSIFSFRLVDFSRWRDQAVSGAKRAGLLLLWFLPLAGTAFYIWNYWMDIGQIDFFTWISNMKDAGGGDFKTGVINTALPLVVMLGSSLVILVAGIAFHSGARHALALGNPAMLRGHHGKLVLGWICSLLFMMPLWIAVLVLAIRLFSLLGKMSDMTAMMNQIKGLKSYILLTLGGGILLTLPLLPLRSLAIAAMVNRLKDNDQADQI